MPRSVITLTTDFGLGSPYVAQMKGVILAIHDQVHLVDISHAIPPQQILAGAVALFDAYRHFPPGTTHVAVVDPGVGTDRAIVLAEMDGHFFVAPDNGLLGLVAARTPLVRSVRLEAREFWGPTISRTFHGRDVMAPVAAHLASGVDFGRFGPSQGKLQTLDFPAVSIEANAAAGAVLSIDAFGNLLTNLEGSVLPAGRSLVTARIGDQPPRDIPVVATYGERSPRQVVLLVGSNGRLELAAVNGDASRVLGVGLGSRVRLSW